MKMVDEKILLSQCVDLANQILKKDMKATISIKIGEEFTFMFENNEVENPRNVKKKSPSQEKRDIKRTLNFKEKFIKPEEKIEAKEEKTQFRIKEEKIDTKAETEENPDNENDIKVEENSFKYEEMCEKVFVIPNYMKDNTNKGIENDITAKLEAKGIKVRKVFVQRAGNPTRGEYYRSIVLIEPWEIKAIQDSEFGIEKCWVLPCK